MIAPPPNRVQAPIVHEVFELYKSFYRIGPKIPKRDRFGIYATTDALCLSIIRDIVVAAIQPSKQKTISLSSACISVELLKRMTRLMRELNIVPEKWHIEIQSKLQEISKMLGGWLRYVNNQKPA